MTSNSQLAQWLPIANCRRVRALDGRPVDFLDLDRAQMLALPPVPPVVDSVVQLRLGRDYYVRVAGNDYSVDPGAIGQLVDVRTTLTHVLVSRAGRRLAAHDRCWAARQTLTDPAHVEAAARCVISSKPARHPPLVIIWCGIWPTMTVPSVSTSRAVQPRPRARWPDHG